MGFVILLIISGYSCYFSYLEVYYFEELYHNLFSHYNKTQTLAEVLPIKKQTFIYSTNTRNLISLSYYFTPFIESGDNFIYVGNKYVNYSKSSYILRCDERWLWVIK